MKAFIYDTETHEIIAIIYGETNEQCEEVALDYGWLEYDKYGLTYDQFEMEISQYVQEIDF